MACSPELISREERDGLYSPEDERRQREISIWHYTLLHILLIFYAHAVCFHCAPW